MSLSRWFLLWRSLLCWLALASSFPVVAAPRINEFLAANDAGLKDEDGDFSDWIEIYNPDGAAVSLAGYYLTDNQLNLNKWKFPAVTLDPGGYLVVFASGKDRRDPAGKLHTSFQLATAGDYLALVAPDKTTILTEFSPHFPSSSTTFPMVSAEPIRRRFGVCSPRQRQERQTRRTAHPPGLQSLCSKKIPRNQSSAH